MQKKSLPLFFLSGVDVPVTISKPDCAKDLRSARQNTFCCKPKANVTVSHNLGGRPLTAVHYI